MKHKKKRNLQNKTVQTPIKPFVKTSINPENKPKPSPDRALVFIGIIASTISIIVTIINTIINLLQDGSTVDPFLLST